MLNTLLYKAALYAMILILALAAMAGASGCLCASRAAQCTQETGQRVETPECCCCAPQEPLACHADQAGKDTDSCAAAANGVCAGTYESGACPCYLSAQANLPKMPSHTEPVSRLLASAVAVASVSFGDDAVRNAQPRIHAFPPLTPSRLLPVLFCALLR